MRWGIALVAVVLCATACTATPESVRPRPTLTPLRLANTPLWTVEPGRNVELRGSSVLLNRGEADLVLADAKTGAPRWMLGPERELRDGAHYRETVAPGPGVRHLLGSGVLVEHETGLALLSADDGSVLWQTAIATPDAGEWVTLRAADDRTAIVAVTSGPPNRSEFTDRPLRTVAVDVGTGHVMWEVVDGVWPVAIAGNVVLGTESPDSPTVGLIPGLNTVVGVDLLSGSRLWDLTGRFGQSTLLLATPEGAVVATATDDTHRTVLVSPATGDELAEFPGRVDACATDHRALIACVIDRDPRFSLYTYTSDAGTVRETTASASAASIVTAFAGRVVLRVTAPNGLENRFHTLDGAGNTIDTSLRLPGDLVAISDDLAIFRTHTMTLAGHEISW